MIDVYLSVARTLLFTTFKLCFMLEVLSNLGIHLFDKTKCSVADFEYVFQGILCFRDFCDAVAQ